MTEKHPFFINLQNSFWLNKFGVILFFVAAAASLLFGYTDLQIFSKYSNKLHFDISLNTLLVSLFIILFSNKKSETKIMKEIKNTSIKLGFMGFLAIIIIGLLVSTLKGAGYYDINEYFGYYHIISISIMVLAVTVVVFSYRVYKSKKMSEDELAEFIHHKNSNLEVLFILVIIIINVIFLTQS